MLADVNGKAGALKLYLGRDVLTVNGNLLPIQWTNYNDAVRRYQGKLQGKDKDLVHKRFEAKVNAHQTGTASADADWSGIRAIIDCVVESFDEDADVRHDRLEGR